MVIKFSFLARVGSRRQRHLLSSFALDLSGTLYLLLLCRFMLNQPNSTWWWILFFSAQVVVDRSSRPASMVFGLFVGFAHSKWKRNYFLLEGEAMLMASHSASLFLFFRDYEASNHVLDPDV